MSMEFTDEHWAKVATCLTLAGEKKRRELAKAADDLQVEVENKTAEYLAEKDRNKRVRLQQEQSTIVAQQTEAAQKVQQFGNMNDVLDLFRECLAAGAFDDEETTDTAVADMEAEGKAAQIEILEAELARLKDE